MLGDGFRPMLQRASWFVCEQCDHGFPMVQISSASAAGARGKTGLHDVMLTREE
jgi:hypothetical protein